MEVAQLIEARRDQHAEGSTVPFGEMAIPAVEEREGWVWSLRLTSIHSAILSSLQ